MKQLSIQEYTRNLQILKNFGLKVLNKDELESLQQALLDIFIEINRINMINDFSEVSSFHAPKKTPIQ